MKNYTYKSGIILLLIILSALSASAAEKPDSKGKEFWLMFTQNYYDFPTLNLYITGDVATSGIVEIPGLGFSATFSVTPGTVTSVSIPATAQVSSSDVVENKGIHVVSQDEVTVYGLNRIPFTTDAFLALPTDILGTEYLTIGYRYTLNETFGIVGTVDGTVLNITPKTTVGSHAAGVSYTVTLNKGQAYQLQGGDLTGSSIISTQPIAVFGGNVCANIPLGYGACDYIVEQLVPMSAWGKSFLTVPLKGRAGDTYKVLASEDNTSVTVNSNAPVLLNKGQFYETILTISSSIIADKPVLVAQYSNGSEYDGAVSDPFMMLIPPFEQFEGSYTVTTPASGFSRNHINIVAANASVGSIKLDGVVIPAASFTAIGSSGYSGAQVDIALGSHTLESTQPFGAFIYGFDNYDSYGYPGGMSLAPIAQVTSLSLSPETANTPFGDNHCLDATVLDQDGNPLEGIRVDFTVSGANSTTGFANTNANGVAQFCYTPSYSGTDYIVASVGSLSDNATNEVGPACTAPELTVPSIAPAANDAGTCGASVTFEATATGSPDPTIVYTIIVEGVEQEITSPYIFPVGTTTVTATATNDCGTDSEIFNVEVTNTAPTINAVSGPADPVAINNSMNLSVAYTDNNVTNAVIDWGDGSAVQNVANPANPLVTPHVYSAPGVYTVKVTLTDACSESSDEYIHQYVVVYDPNGSFVTGGGWIDSPAGSYVADPTAEGKANFGFVSKYKKGANVPDGQTQFQFHAAGFNFHSTSYEWLVVSGYKAQFKGVGTVNGSGDYGFLLSAVDGALKSTDPVDRFRIKVWDRGTGVVVYDNQMGDADDAEAGTAIGGGSIVIHEPMKGSSAKRSVAAESPSVTTEGNFNVYPTAFSDKTTIAFSLDKAEDYVLEVFDTKGALVKKLTSGTAEANKLYELELNSEGMADGVYITRLTTTSNVRSIKAVLKR